ncbi:MAG: hypothetical protein IRZ13_21910 [Acetobacteraceae bacterium]|nr:hypothetical protein [Acetobacteraceae bacterium]
MSEDRYDEGLVHDHGWAREKVTPGIGRGPAVVLAPAVEEAYDDGLVHGHAWASSERGRPASPPPPPAE